MNNALDYFVGNCNNLIIFQRKMIDVFENKTLNINNVYEFIDQLTYII